MKKILLMGFLFVAIFLVGCSDSATLDDGVRQTDGAAKEYFDDYDVICTGQQKQATICSADYRPVCADDGESYSNGCSACAAQVVGWSQGECLNG